MTLPGRIGALPFFHNRKTEFTSRSPQVGDVFQWKIEVDYGPFDGETPPAHSFLLTRVQIQNGNVWMTAVDLKTQDKAYFSPDIKWCEENYILLAEA